MQSRSRAAEMAADFAETRECMGFPELPMDYGRMRANRAHRAGSSRRNQAMGGRSRRAGAAPRSVRWDAATHADTSREGAATGGTSAGKADRHNIAQQGPGPLL